MKKKRYQDSNTTSIYNFVSQSPLDDWFHPSDFNLGGLRTSTLSQDNRSRMEKIYGKQHQTWTGEFRFKVWNIEFEGLNFWVLSASTKGTSIEIEKNYSEITQHDLEITCRFIDMLFRKLHNCEAGWLPPDWQPPLEAIQDLS